MQVEILKKDGKVMFVESGSDFADFLTGTLKAPLGSLVGLSSAGCGVFGNLQSSVNRVRAPLFLGKKEQDTAVKPLDLQAIAEGKSQTWLATELAVVGNSRYVSQRSVVNGEEFKCTVGQVPGSWQGVAFSKVDQFELSMDYQYWQSYNVMMGFFPSDSADVGTLVQNGGSPFSQGFFLYLTPGGLYLHSKNGDNGTPFHLQNGQTFPGAASRVVRMRYGKSNGNGRKQLEFDFFSSGQWETASFTGQLPSEEVFPALLFYSNVNHNAQVMIKPYSGAAVPKVFHSLTKFLVANDLTLCESTSLKALEILRKFGVGNADELEIESVTITEDVLRRLLGRAISGHQDVLQFAFEQGLAEAASAQGGA
ncbi:unnamed protein product [Amoebophrya sp. A120]|nr:unnamed protein product [Amoebophrya sp. A120]|eukprot:GSA120T00018821001.1